MDDVDAALEGLSEKELAEINEYVDPENLLLPSNERQESNTSKAPTGPLDRSRLMAHMKAEAEKSTVGKGWLEYDGEKKGKVYKAPEKTQKAGGSRKGSTSFTSTGDAELDALLCQVEDADMGDLADLAEALDVHGLTTQHRVQQNSVGLAKRDDGLRPVKAAVPVYKKDEADTFEVKVDVAEAVQQASANDASLTKLNLNNNDEVTSDHLSDISRAMLTNNHVTHLQLVNTGFTDAHVQVLAESLEYNRCLRVLNLESNRITGTGARRLVAALKDNSTLEELRLNNQVSALGNHTESELAEMLEHNRTLRKIGYTFKNAGPRARIDRLLLRNNDLARQQRVSNSNVSYS